MTSPLAADSGLGELETTRPKASAPIILPRFVNFIDKNGKYMSLGNWPSINITTLTCVKQEPDASCTFEAIPGAYPSHIAFLGINEQYISHDYTNVQGTPNVGYFFCYGTYRPAYMFEVIQVQGNQVYLHWAGTLPRFITNRNYGISSINTLAASVMADSDCLFTISEPIISREIIEVVYDIPKALMTDVSPLIALNATVRNDSQTSQIQQTLTYSYTRSKVGTWNNTAGIQLGVASSFTAGLPFLSVNHTISVTAEYSRQWGGSEGIEETVSSSTQVTVPPGKKSTVTVVVKRKNFRHLLHLQGED